ncbi:MAG: chemotaxis protein CheW [Nitrospirae bacterium]|nr:chemotaxis protein CheW [Nitrospirota bacterium]
MENEIFEDYPWVIFMLKDELYGISAKYVITMIGMPKIVAAPNQPEWIRGLITLRGSVIPLVDCRKRLQLPSYKEEIDELVDTMLKREQDHKNWINELENSVKENREFKLTTNPHMCAFGKWYDSYTAQNPSVERFLKKFDVPHKKIHNIAVHVKEAVHANNVEEATRLISATRHGELSYMIELFAGFRALITDLINNEISLVIEANGKKVALSVDSIVSVEKLKEGSITKMPNNQESENKMAGMIGTMKGTGKFVILLETNELLDNEVVLESLVA